MIRILAALLTLAAAGCGAAPIAPTPPVPQPNPPAPIPPPPPPRLSLTKILAFGDSMTEGQNGALLPNGLFIPDVRQIVVESESYPVRLQTKLRDRYTAQDLIVFREGIGGEFTSAGLSRLPGALQKDQPELVLLLEGANDLNTFQLNGVAPAVSNVDSMVKLCLARGLRVMLAGLPPQRPGGTPPRGNSAALVAPYNGFLRAVAQANGIEFIDTQAAFAGDLTLLGPDGLHPNAAGYERMAQAFYDRLVAKYELPTASSKAQRGGAEVAEDFFKEKISLRSPRLCVELFVRRAGHFRLRSELRRTAVALAEAVGPAVQLFSSCLASSMAASVVVTSPSSCRS